MGHDGLHWRGALEDCACALPYCLQKFLEQPGWGSPWGLRHLVQCPPGKVWVCDSKPADIWCAADSFGREFGVNGFIFNGGLASIASSLLVVQLREVLWEEDWQQDVISDMAWIVIFWRDKSCELASLVHNLRHGDHSMIKLLYSAATQHNELSNVNVIFSLDYLYYMQAIYWESYS